MLGSRARIRLAGKVLQVLGIVIAAVSLAGLSGLTMSRASASLVRLVAQVAAAVAPSPSPQPATLVLPGASPSGGPSPTPTPAPVLRRGGPIEVSLNGSLSLGENSASSTRTDLFGNPIVNASNEASTALGLYAELRRRTGSSTTDLRLPIGFSKNGTQIGDAAIEFSTAHYALFYGTQQVSLLGQVTVGQTLRGPALVLPLTAGDITFYSGPALGVDGETLHLRGLRARRLVGRNLLELGVVRSADAPLTGSSTTVITGLATARGSAAFVGELAFQERQTPTGPVHGMASQWRLDLGEPTSSFEVTMRHTPDRFLAYGGSELYADQYEDFAYHSSGKRTLSTDLTYESTGPAGALTKTRRSAVSYGGTIGVSSYQLTFQDQRVGGVQSPQWSGSAGVQFGFPIKSGFLLFGEQIGRFTTIANPPTGSSAFALQLQRTFGPFALQISGNTQRQFSDLNGVSKLSLVTFSAQRTFGKAGIGYTYTINRTQSSFADSLQTAPQIQISRQISPALSVQLAYGMQHLTDFRTPTNSGNSRLFNFSINAPFGFGNGVVQGRIDPRLPALISGRVVTDLGDNAAVAGLAPGGVGNIVVVLDDTEIQRTDLDGNFQFSFVKPGQHQLRLESSSLPRGLTADNPIYTLDLQGGQTGQVYFRIGDFGGVTGHVFGRDSNGAQIPLANVVLKVDGAQFSQTDKDGAYGFGRLQPGTHTISVVQTSVPAFASFDAKTATQKINVQNGILSTLDFVAQPLGSIAGFVYFDKALGAPNTGGVGNVYVVAEPGEHAAITDYDGSFIIDNLPPGTYSVSVDPETVPDETSPEGDPVPVTLVGNDHYQGAVFILGHKVKSVVFSFLGNGASGASARVEDKRLPPGGDTTLVYTATTPVKDAVATAFGVAVPLTYDKKRAEWLGSIDVPPGTKPGTYDVSVKASGISTSATTNLIVDPSMPIVIMQITPPNVAIGSYAGVRARFLVDVRAGDRINWSDGTTTILGKPVSGRVFTFSLRVSLRPLYGVLLTRHGRLPIRLL